MIDANTPAEVFCLDTNVLIEPWNKYLPIHRSPEFWGIIDTLAAEGRIFCTQEVRREIEREDDELKNWIADRPHLFREVTEEVQVNLRSILKRFPRLVDTRRDRSMADPWVIAHAMAENAIVVTKEIGTPVNSNTVKIPDVCDDFGVEWMNDFQFHDRIGLRLAARLEDDS